MFHQIRSGDFLHAVDAGVGVEDESLVLAQVLFSVEVFIEGHMFLWGVRVFGCAGETGSQVCQAVIL